MSNTTIVAGFAVVTRVDGCVDALGSSVAPSVAPCVGGSVRRDAGGGDAGEFEEGVGESLFAGRAAVTAEDAGPVGMFALPAGVDDGIKHRFQRGAFVGSEEAGEANGAFRSSKEPEASQDVLAGRGVVAVLVSEAELFDVTPECFRRCTNSRERESVDAVDVHDGAKRSDVLARYETRCEECLSGVECGDHGGDAALLAGLVVRDAGGSDDLAGGVTIISQRSDQDRSGGIGFATDPF